MSRSNQRNVLVYVVMVSLLSFVPDVLGQQQTLTGVWKLADAIPTIACNVTLQIDEDVIFYYLVTGRDCTGRGVLMGTLIKGNDGTLIFSVSADNRHSATLLPIHNVVSLGGRFVITEYSLTGAESLSLLTGVFGQSTWKRVPPTAIDGTYAASYLVPQVNLLVDVHVRIRSGIFEMVALPYSNLQPYSFGVFEGPLDDAHYEIAASNFFGALVNVTNMPVLTDYPHVTLNLNLTDFIHTPLPQNPIAGTYISSIDPRDGGCLQLFKVGHGFGYVANDGNTCNTISAPGTIAHVLIRATGTNLTVRAVFRFPSAPEVLYNLPYQFNGTHLWLRDNLLVKIDVRNAQPFTAAATVQPTDIAINSNLLIDAGTDMVTGCKIYYVVDNAGGASGATAVSSLLSSNPSLACIRPLSTAAIAGICVGAVVLIAIPVLILIPWLRSKKLAQFDANANRGLRDKQLERFREEMHKPQSNPV